MRYLEKEEDYEPFIIDVIAVTEMAGEGRWGSGGRGGGGETEGVVLIDVRRSVRGEEPEDFGVKEVELIGSGSGYYVKVKGEVGVYGEENGVV